MSFYITCDYCGESIVGRNYIKVDSSGYRATTGSSRAIASITTRPHAVRTASPPATARIQPLEALVSGGGAHAVSRPLRARVAPRSIRGIDRLPLDPGTSIYDLKVNSRTRLALVRSGIRTVSELSQRTRFELSILPGVGPKAVDEIAAALGVAVAGREC
jgi:hypothetical protein